MTVVGITMVKDEADILPSTLGHMLQQVDAVIVADNGSTDGTLDMLRQVEALEHGRLLVVEDADPAYLQSEKMTRLARLAGQEYGATWIVPFDADEVWYSPHGRLAEQLELHTAWSVVPASLYDHVATAVDVEGVEPVERMVWRRREPAPLPKVACRYSDHLVIEQGNHGAHYDLAVAISPPTLVVRHFPYRSAEQFVRKARNGAAAYAATDLPVNVGQHWRGYGNIAEQFGDEACAAIFTTWFWSADADGLIFDPAWAAVDAAQPENR